MVRIKIGTSGYSYSWNEGKPTPFEWYILQGFDTVEINASFYRFPGRSWVKAWSKCPADFDFSIKVHRSITHYSKLRGKALHLWRRFKEPLGEIAPKITFWLFQMPPTFTFSDRNLDAVTVFFKELNLGNSAVVEFRHESWWRHADVCREGGFSFCSVDAPKLPRDIIEANDVIYLRLHGRERWYSYIYSDRELLHLVKRLNEASASKKYMYLNNDHGMLENGKFLMKLVRE